MPIRFQDSAPSAFVVSSPAGRAAFLEHARTVLGALQESGMDDEAWHLHRLAEILAAGTPINETTIRQAVVAHLRAEGIESQNGEDDPLPRTLIRLLHMAAERADETP